MAKLREHIKQEFLNALNSLLWRLNLSNERHLERSLSHLRDFIERVEVEDETE